MGNDLKPEWSPDEPYVRGSLKHTADLIEGARGLFDKNLPHLAYHFALLALEEIGKLEIVLMGRVSSEEEEALFRKKFLDDHVGKIFWAFWGPSFSRDLLDQKQIQWHQDLARQLHEKRLRGLYAEPSENGFTPPSDQVSPVEARRLIDLAQARLDMQREHKPVTLSDDEKADLAWFRAARYDAKKKAFILSPGSAQKLAELGSTRNWMKWLRENVEKQEAELLALAEAEMRREIVDGDLDRPKWKFRIRLRTNSHVIRPKAVKRWNEMDTPIRWVFVDKKPDQLLVEFSVPKSILAKDLYDVGLAFAYRFIVALNIGSRGFFWFDLPTQTEKFHDSIEDVETNAMLDIGRVPVRRVSRTVEPLTDRDIQWIAIAFGLLPHEASQLGPFRQYLGGLVYWAKTDVHSGFEVQAFGAFFDCFQSAMYLYGDWDGKAPFRDAAIAVLGPQIMNVEESIDEIVALADAQKLGHAAPELNIEQAAVMKLFADVYLCVVLDREGMRHSKAAKEAQTTSSLSTRVGC